MARDRGKEFENKFKEDFAKIPGATIDRLYDPVGSFYGVHNVCDFIGYVYPFIFYIECKSIKGNTFPLVNLTQFEALQAKKGIQGVVAGVVIWFIEHNRIAWVPIEEFERLMNEGYKSVNVKMIDNPEFSILEIPGILKRVHIDADYSVLVKQAELAHEGERYDG